ncbi:MAG: hypothetical protein R3F61_33980 [Myxococcota bacterium]
MTRIRQNTPQQYATRGPVEHPPVCGSTSNAAVIAEMNAAQAPTEEHGFLAGLDNGFGAPIEDHRATLTTEDVLLDRPGSRSYPKRWRDNRLHVPRAAQRPLAAESRRTDGTYHDFDISDSTDFESVFEHYSDHGDCAVASYETLENMGYEKPRGDRHSVLGRGEIGESRDGNVTKVDPEGAMKLLDAIDAGLADGKPVMLGVDYAGEQHGANADGVTDHWLVVTNRTYDEKTGEVRYEAVDNASGDACHRVFTVGEDYGLRSAPPPEAGPNSGIGQLPYTATNARIPERKQ